MRPTIGIPLSLDARGRWREGRDYLYLDHAYTLAVEAAGGRPVLLPMQDDADALVERIDGLLLPGGDDFLPASPYPDDVAFDPTPDAQIAFDRRLLEAAWARALPVLGICYGAQLIAVARGGRLHHHLPSDVPGAGSHRLPERSGRHALALAPGSRLAALFAEAHEPASGPLRVNSLHHQAIAEPGRDMRTCAHAEDGVIEAIEHVGPRFELGVQWHPEKMPGEPGSLPIRALVAACTGG